MVFFRICAAIGMVFATASNCAKKNSPDVSNGKQILALLDATPSPETTPVVDYCPGDTSIQIGSIHTGGPVTPPSVARNASKLNACDSALADADAEARKFTDTECSNLLGPGAKSKLINWLRSACTCKEDPPGVIWECEAFASNLEYACCGDIDQNPAACTQTYLGLPNNCATDPQTAATCITQGCAGFDAATCNCTHCPISAPRNYCRLGSNADCAQGLYCKSLGYKSPTDPTAIVCRGRCEILPTPTPSPAPSLSPSPSSTPEPSPSPSPSPTP